MRRTHGRDRPADVDHDHDRDHDERIPGDVHLRVHVAREPLDRAPDDQEARHDEDCALAERGEMLRFPVPVLVPGVRGPRRDADGNEALFDEIVAINMKGAFNTVRLALPFLANGASIIVTRLGSTAWGLLDRARWR